MSVPSEHRVEPSAPSSAAQPRAPERLAVAVFLLLFLVPMFLRATLPRLQLPFPRVLVELHNIACLFTHKPEGWSSYYVQVLYPGERSWTTLDESELFPLAPFGRRTRMHRYLVAWKAKESALTRDMAQWILKQHIARHPQDFEPIAIRFTRTWMIPELGLPPQRGWRHPTWLEVPVKRRRVIAAYSSEELLAGTKPEAAAP